VKPGFGGERGALRRRLPKQVGRPLARNLPSSPLHLARAGNRRRNKYRTSRGFFQAKQFLIVNRSISEEFCQKIVKARQLLLAWIITPKIFDSLDYF
jgi:hypothetical protein